jgi:hypothetical protein
MSSRQLRACLLWLFTCALLACSYLDTQFRPVGPAQEQCVRRARVIEVTDTSALLIAGATVIGHLEVHGAPIWDEREFDRQASPAAARAGGTHVLLVKSETRHDNVQDKDYPVAEYRVYRVRPERLPELPFELQPIR